MNEEEQEAIEYFKQKIKNKLPLYEETYVDGKPYRKNILQLESNYTEEQANKASIILNLIDKQQKEIEDIKKNITEEGFFNIGFDEAIKCIRDKIKEKIERLEVSGSLEDDIGVLYLKQLLAYLEEFLRRITNEFKRNIK